MARVFEVILYRLHMAVGRDRKLGWDDMLPVLPIIAGLAQLAPAILPLLTRDETARRAADAVSLVARQITGQNSDEAALTSLKAEPGLQLEFQRAMNEHAIQLFQDETRRLEAINATIRAEVASMDPYVRRWRPTFGYIGALSFGAMMLGLAYTIFDNPSEAAKVATAIGSMSGVWAPLMAVLGVAVWARSQDKKPPQTATLASVARRLLAGD